MSLDIAGLSERDKQHYYQGSILGHKDGLFKVVEVEGNFRGHLLIDGVWTPKTCSAKALSIIYPKEGYILLKGHVHTVSQTIRRTRRKGFTSETYAVSPLVSGGARYGVMDTSTLEHVFHNPSLKDWKEATTALKQKECRGYVFSKDLCVVKCSNTREVWLRGIKLGRVKRTGLELPKKYRVFLTELNEYNIPSTLV